MNLVDLLCIPSCVVQEQLTSHFLHTPSRMDTPQLHITVLPAEILSRIFSFFDAPTLLGMERVCRLWGQISNTVTKGLIFGCYFLHQMQFLIEIKPLLWRNLCLKKQRGATELISYRLSFVDASKKRKRGNLCITTVLNGIFRCVRERNMEANVLPLQLLFVVSRW